VHRKKVLGSNLYINYDYMLYKAGIVVGKKGVGHVVYRHVTRRAG
jgi:hypothetical protein